MRYLDHPPIQKKKKKKSPLKSSLFACKFESFTGGILLMITFRLGRSFKIFFDDFTIFLLTSLWSFVLISLIPQCAKIAFTGPSTDSSDLLISSVFSVLGLNTSNP